MSIMRFLFCVDVVALLGYKCGARRLDNLEEDVRTRLWVLRTVELVVCGCVFLLVHVSSFLDQ